MGWEAIEDCIGEFVILGKLGILDICLDTSYHLHSLLFV